MRPELRYAALLIGNSVYPDDPHNLPELRGPVNDLPMLRDALTNPEVGLFETARVRGLPERSKREITTAMDEFFQRATRDDLVLVYYSGHGRRDEYDNLYLCARDTRTNLLMSTAISDQEINGMMRSSSASTFIVILDCCYSGSFKGAGLPTNLRGAGRFLITSSRHGQLSADSDDPSGASAFTRHLVDGLKSGTLDLNGDGYVSLNEVYDYVLTRLREDTKQIPERHFDHTVGDVAMARSRGSSTIVTRPDAQRPELAVSETEIAIRKVLAGETLPPEIVDVFNRGTGELDWFAEADADWIRVDSQAGYVRLWLDPRPGSNRGNVRVRDRGGGGSKTIRVHVEVLTDQQRPRLQLSTRDIDFGELRVGVDSPSRSVQLINLGGGSLDATSSPTHPWIKLRHFGETVDVTVETREAGDVAGEIMVTSAGGEGRIGVRAHVRPGPVLEVGLTEVDFGQVTVGQKPVRLIPVRNSGGGQLEWDFGHLQGPLTTERVPEGVAVRLRSNIAGPVRGSVWVGSNGGQAVVELRADVVRAEGRDARRPRLLVVLIVASVVAVGIGVVVGRTAWALMHPQWYTSGNPSPTPLSTFTPTPAGGPDGVRVPHVYNLSEGAGASELRAASFQVRSIYVCSSSVVRGNVRQVLTDAGDRDGAVVDDQGGVRPAGAGLTRGTALVMKISTGVACNPSATTAPSTAIPSPTAAAKPTVPTPTPTPRSIPTP